MKEPETYAFADGLLKAAATQSAEQEKQAYGKRLTELLQRKGKLAPEAKPNVGVSSFPKQADTFLPWTLLQEKLQETGQGLQQGIDQFGKGVKDVVGRGVDDIRGTARQIGSDISGVADRAHDALFETPTERFIRHGKGHLKDFQQSDIGQVLSRLLQDGANLPNTHPRLASGLAGAGVGGLAGALSGKSENKETGEKGTRGRNALLGSLLGGGAGVGAHALATSDAAKQALLHARTAGMPPSAEYRAPHQALRTLDTPLDLSQNASPSTVSVKPRF